MTTTTVVARPGGTEIPATFVGITTAKLTETEWLADGSIALTFDQALTTTQQVEIAKRVAAKDDGDWSRRKALLAQVDAATTLAETQAALRMLVRYVLGDTSTTPTVKAATGPKK